MIESVSTRKAQPSDLRAIKEIADANKNELGFVTRATIEQAISDGNIMVICTGLLVVGFQHYYHRKRDKQTTLYHKAISSDYRSHKLGTTLVNSVINEAKEIGREKLILKCPANLPSNQFHLKIGFRLVRTEAGKKRSLNVYEYLLFPKISDRTSGEEFKD